MGPDAVTAEDGLNYFWTALSGDSPRHETADQSSRLPPGLTVLYNELRGWGTNYTLYAVLRLQYVPLALPRLVRDLLVPGEVFEEITE